MANIAGGADGPENGRGRRGVSRRTILKGAAVAGVAAPNAGLLADMVSAAQSAVAVENQQTGSLPSEWSSDYDSSIVGYTPDLSVLPGATVRFKVSTTSSNYRIRIYRLGWYGGRGARRLADVTPSVPLPQTQPSPDIDQDTRLVDCGRWITSATWTVPNTAVSGVYYALFDRLDGGGSNHTLFVVRSNTTADVLVQTSDATWHAYNLFGGASLYFGRPEAPFFSQKATKVSYNRPLSDVSEKESEFFGTEYALLRWIERNGYDVHYCTQLDTHADAAMLRRHKVFISSGHDEYWTGAQRANVTAARDAGVNLIFFSGNEVFWRTRLESSIDGQNTPNRTLVCYKETLAGAKIDPSSEWTGTWRDPRFTPPALGGGQPENALTGQLFRCINPVNAPDFELEVPSDYSALRFWRNTEIASLAPGEKVTLAESTLGYEWDEVVDNGFQPAGTIRLSRTTATANEVLIDNGATYVRASATHHLTMYRAESGALVFGAGTVQWAYGLDENHRSDPGTATDPNIQQATVNLLADMGAQPSTLQTGLVGASPSADTLAPTATIDSPAAGTSMFVGAAVAVGGSAVDSGGGHVAAIEVSTDGGASWHPAAGTTSWSYVFTPTVVGPVEVQVRATDDSCNTQPVPTTRSFNAGQRSLPAPLFHDGMLPAAASVNDPDGVELGVRLQPLEDGFLTAVRFYKGPGNTGTHIANVWTASGSRLTTATFTNETSTGWQSVPITPLPVVAGTTYVVSVFMPNGHYAATDRFFESPFELWPLRAPANGEGGLNGLYRYGTSSGFPTEMWGATNYWVDAVFDDSSAQNPVVTSTAPSDALQSVALDSTVAVTFSRTMNGATIVFQLKDATNAPIAGTSTYVADTRTSTFTPTAPLAAGTTYTATVVSATDSTGTPLLQPYTWTFTTAAGTTNPAVLSIWDSSATPAQFSNETDPLELGTRFTSDVDGAITALQFYKAAGSPGPHIGHLWNDAGQLIATAAYNNETASGWQQVELSSPVSISKNRSYVVSYYSPAGVYPLTAGYFSSADTVSGSLRAPRSTSSAGNGLYRYGAVAYPNGTWNASNYWADVVFTTVAVGSAPTVTNIDPAPGLVGVALAGPVRVTFDSSIDPQHLDFVVRTPSGSVVTATVTYDDATRTATLSPSGGFAAGTLYNVSVSARSTTGVAMASPFTSSFTAAAAAGATPVTLWTNATLPAELAAADTAAVELGTRFTVDRDGLVTAVRFFKGPGNEGPHVGRIWSATGTLLGTASFPNETASGWQQGNLTAPVSVAAGSSYVVSYHAPVGRYSVSASYFTTNAVDNAPLHAPATRTGAGNGLFAYGSGGFPSNTFAACNYFVDLVFVDLAAPTVVASVPAAGAIDVATSSTVSADFSEAIDVASLVFQVRDGGGAVAGGSVAYDSSARRATFTPSTSWVTGASYTVSVTASDLQGNPMPSPAVWSFTITAPAQPPTFVSLWSDTAVPAVTSSGESAPVELGVKIRTDVPGKIYGLRFFKGAGNTGTHVGTLWADGGAVLARATFADETESGWQSVLFDTPVAIAPGATYVASYHLPNGNYPYDVGFFVNNEVVSGPLRAPADGAFGGNGVFVYGAGGYPTGTWGGSSYWVDVIFSTT